MPLSFSFGTFIGGVVCALLLGAPSPHSSAFTAFKWVTTLDEEPAADPVLHYFDVRGRAEAIRLTFAEKEVSYEEKNFTGEAWGKTSSTGLKANFTAAGQLAFGQVPMLEVDGLHVVQSHSILRFAARKYKWYEAYTAEELMRIDVAADGTEDVRKQIMGIKYDDASYPTTADKKAAWAAWFAADDKGVLWYGHFEALLSKPWQPKRWLASTEAPSHADFLLFDLLDTAAALEPSSATSLLAKFPTLTKWKAALAARPNVAAYLASRKPV
jgi:glutathione S-transferase